MWKKLDGAFTTHRNELMKDSLKKKQNDEDPRVRENTLNNDLENMTHMAQHLDKEHRRLTDQQQKLKIQYSSQENDKDLLLKQIIYYKKQHKQIKEEHARMKEELDRQTKEEEETARMLDTNMGKQPRGGKPPKMPEGAGMTMPTIMKNKR